MVRSAPTSQTCCTSLHFEIAPEKRIGKVYTGWEYQPVLMAIVFDRSAD